MANHAHTTATSWTSRHATPTIAVCSLAVFPFSFSMGFTHSFFSRFFCTFFLEVCPLQTGAVLRLSTAQPSVRSALIRIFIAQTSLPSISFVAMTRVAPHRSLVRFLLPCGHPCAQGGLLGRGGVPRYPFQKKWSVCIPYGCPRQAGSRKHPARAFGCKHLHPLFHKGSSCVYVFFFCSWVSLCLCVCALFGSPFSFAPSVGIGLLACGSLFGSIRAARNYLAQ